MTDVARKFFKRLQRRLDNERRGVLRRYGLNGLRGVELRFLFTCHRGIFLFDRGRVVELYTGRYFGITATPGNTIHAAEWVGDRAVQKTHVYRFDFDGRRIVNRQQLVFRDAAGNVLQPFGIHQIRYLNGYLWVTNTRENVLWKCTLEGTVLDEWSEEGKMPFDESNFQVCNRLRKNSVHYRHYNSLAFHGDHYYVVAHNCYQDQNDREKRSYAVKLDANLNVVDRIEDLGRGCHDAAFTREALWVCNSLEGKLMKNGRPVMDLGAFLRGIGVIGSIMVIGGSPYQLERQRRDDAHSKLFFIDYPARRLLFTMELGRVGNILDIMTLDDEPAPAATVPR